MSLHHLTPYTLLSRRARLEALSAAAAAAHDAHAAHQPVLEAVEAHHAAMAGGASLEDARATREATLQRAEDERANGMARAASLLQRAAALLERLPPAPVCEDCGCKVSSVPGPRGEPLCTTCEAHARRLELVPPACTLCPPRAPHPATTEVEGSPACERCAEDVAEEDARRALERASRARRVEDETAAADFEIERRKDSGDPIHHS